ncbi:hypothetical protein AAX07_03470 [Moraxella bovoculi]|nr:hypothetical protein AAX07_03470 [Moraxella bovoculi]
MAKKVAINVSLTITNSHILTHKREVIKMTRVKLNIINLIFIFYQHKNHLSCWRFFLAKGSFFNKKRNFIYFFLDKKGK